MHFNRLCLRCSRPMVKKNFLRNSQRLDFMLFLCFTTKKWTKKLERRSSYQSLLFSYLLIHNVSTKGK